MPPKTRGRVGRGRGGTARGDLSATPAQDPVVPKQEDGDDAPPPAGDTPQASTAEPPATHAPRQRLDSLAAPTSRSASPSVRGRGRGKKPAPAMPVFTGRRSKVERDARTADALSREQERNKDREKEAARAAKRREFEEKRRSQSTRGRGGYSGIISGPFSDPTQRARDKAPIQRGFGGGGGYGSGSGSRTTIIKGESGSGGGSSYRGGGGSVKREGGGFISSDEEDDEEASFPRMDVQHIEISSDEEPGAPKERMAAPVRISRKEHKERVVGINTEASSETAPKTRPKTEGTDTTHPADVPQRTTNKGKGKAKDFEITGERKQYKGVWQDSEDSDVKVKTEPTSEDEEEVLGAEQVGIGASAANAEDRGDALPGPERKPRPHVAKPEPEFQTEEERAEWARFQDNLDALIQELGPSSLSATVDASGDVAMADAGPEAKPKDIKEDRIYVFQLPPIMPDLTAPGVKKESSNVQADAPESAAQAEGKRAAGKPEGVPVKKEEDFSNPLGDIPERSRFASGYVGKLRVHKSGRTTLDWGGTSCVLTPGKQPGFVQEIVSLNIDPEADKEPEADAGEALCFGNVKGKFIVTPDFRKLLG